MDRREFQAILTRWQQMSSSERLEDLLRGEYTRLTDMQAARLVSLLEPPERQELVRRVLGADALALARQDGRGGAPKKPGQRRAVWRKMHRRAPAGGQNPATEAAGAAASCVGSAGAE